MALKQVEPNMETIGENKFYITPFPAFKAANITGELASVLTPLLGSLAPLVGDGDGLFDMDVSKAATVLSNSVGFDGAKIENLMKKLLLGGHIVVEIEDENGSKDHVRLDMDTANEIFCGDVQDMFILCFYVIRLNFNGFFKRFAPLFGNAETQGVVPETMVRAIL